MTGNKIDLTGQRFGRLVVVQETKERDFNSVVWECKCECGGVAFVSSARLRCGDTKSCGCLQKEKISKILSDQKIHAKIIAAKRKTVLVENTDLSRLNQKLFSNNTSGYRGVCWNKRAKKWIASINLKGKRIHLGCFINKQDAINARLEAEDKYFKPILEKYNKKD